MCTGVPIVSCKPVLTNDNSASFQRPGHSPQSNADSRDVGPSSAWHHRNKRLTPVKWWSNASSELRLFKSGRPST